MTPNLPLAHHRVLGADAMRSLVDLGDGPDDDFFSLAQRTLRSLLCSAGLLDSFGHAEPGAFSRRLLFSDPMGRFGIWAIDWPAGCRTPVHNHHCSCAYGVYVGSIEEITYAVEAAGDTAVESARCRRDVGYVGGSPLGSGLVHEMLNSSADPAVSIHIYAYRPDHHADSIDRCFTAARTSRRPDAR